MLFFLSSLICFIHGGFLNKKEKKKKRSLIIYLYPNKVWVNPSCYLDSSPKGKCDHFVGFNSVIFYIFVLHMNTMYSILGQFIFIATLLYIMLCCIPYYCTFPSQKKERVPKLVQLCKKEKERKKRVLKQKL